VLTTEQVAQCRVGSNAESLVTMQMLVAVRDSGDKCIILNTNDLVFWMPLSCSSCSCSSNQ